MHCLNIGPVAGMFAIGVANLMTEAIAPRMGKLVINVRDLIISKPCVVQRLQQPSQRPALTKARSNISGEHPLGSNGGNGKSGGKRQHFKKGTPKKPQKQKAYEVTFKKTVPSEATATSGGEREKGKVSRQKTVLSGPKEEGTYNRFSCDAAQSKMTHSTNTKSKSKEGLYTDTDPDHSSEIITDVTIRVPGKSWYHDDGG